MEDVLHIRTDASCVAGPTSGFMAEKLPDAFLLPPKFSDHYPREKVGAR